ncbi:MAG: RHS repeat-associated core domain-containing protein [Candidatus Binataceae bacterium]
MSTDGSSLPNVTAKFADGTQHRRVFCTERFPWADGRSKRCVGCTGPGAPATSYTYDPFGNVTLSGSSNANPYEFTGRKNDATGLHFYRARYYSPTYPRFIAQDPIGLRPRRCSSQLLAPAELAETERLFLIAPEERQLDLSSEANHRELR